MLALDLHTELETRLGRLAEQTGREPTDLGLEALAEQLDGLEELAVVERRWRDHIEGRSESVPLEEVIRRHDLAD